MVEQNTPPVKSKKASTKGSIPKFMLFVGISALVLVAGVSIINLKGFEDPPKFGTKKTACQILSRGVAQRMLNSAKQDDSTGSHKESNENSKITHCTYISTSKDLPKDSYYAVSLTVYAPKTTEGVGVNKQLFDKAGSKPGIMFIASNNGIKQFWDPNKGELELLKGNSRYTIVVGSKKASDRNYARAQELAELLKKQF